MTTPPIPPPHQPPSPSSAIKGEKKAKPSETEKKTAEVAKRRSSAEESRPKRLTRSLSNETHTLSTATLFKACKKNLLKDAKVHLKQGASVKSVDSNQQTPLHIATAQADKDLVALLLTHLPDLTAQDIKGQTVAHIACRRGDFSICTLVCTLRNYRILDLEGCDAIHYLAKM
ncbi:MAG: ankyrin repeat domain-containing protein, partial [Chlamydiia bacterium]|nr:ankyrin repeat domain-containing protein [Chlamydiia bacterium]